MEYESDENFKEPLRSGLAAGKGCTPGQLKNTSVPLKYTRTTFPEEYGRFDSGHFAERRCICDSARWMQSLGFTTAQPRCREKRDCLFTLASKRGVITSLANANSEVLTSDFSSVPFVNSENVNEEGFLNLTLVRFIRPTGESSSSTRDS